MGPFRSQGQDVGAVGLLLQLVFFTSTDCGPGKSWGRSLGEEAKPASALDVTVL